MSLTRCFLVERDAKGRLQVASGETFAGPLYADRCEEFSAPGAMYFEPISPDSTQCPHAPICTQHLIVICPDGCPWDIDSRSNTCPLPGEGTHRCWIRKGEPPDITVGKLGGRSCPQGGGSIRTRRGGHYWLIEGKFREANSGEAHPTEGDFPYDPW